MFRLVPGVSHQYTCQAILTLNFVLQLFLAALESRYVTCCQKSLTVKHDKGWRHTNPVVPDYQVRTKSAGRACFWTCLRCSRFETDSKKRSLSMDSMCFRTTRWQLNQTPRKNLARDCTDRRKTELRTRFVFFHTGQWERERVRVRECAVEVNERAREGTRVGERARESVCERERVRRLKELLSQCPDITWQKVSGRSDAGFSSCPPSCHWSTHMREREREREREIKWFSSYENKCAFQCVCVCVIKR